MPNEYDKPAIMKILMDRDNLTEYDAVEVIREVQTLINLELEGDCNSETIQSIIEDNLGLEGDYILAFVSF